MDDKLNLEESGLGLNITPKEEPKEELQAEVQELEEEVVEEYVPEELTEPEDLDEKNYLQISPTFCVQYVEPEDPDDVDEDAPQLYKILNPETGTAEKRPLTDEEKREIYIFELKESRKTFKPTKHPKKTVAVLNTVDFRGKDRRVKQKEFVTNETVNPYGTKYKQKRKRKNTLAKKSRRANRK